MKARCSSSVMASSPVALSAVDGDTATVGAQEVIRLIRQFSIVTHSRSMSKFYAGGQTR